MYEVRLEYRGPIPGRTLKKRNLNRIYKAGFTEWGSAWHGEILPIHFTVAGGRRYGYAKRKGEGGGRWYRRSYMYRKRRVKGHSNPLVWSGRSRSLAKRRHLVATSKGLRVYIHAPALNLRHPASRVNMRREVTAITPDEISKLEKVFTKSVDRSLKAVRRKMRIRP